MNKNMDEIARDWAKRYAEGDKNIDYVEDAILGAVNESCKLLIEALRKISATIPRFQYVLLDKDGRDIWLHDFINKIINNEKK